jgi:hypothetical protein
MNENRQAVWNFHGAKNWFNQLKLIADYWTSELRRFLSIFPALMNDLVASWFSCHLSKNWQWA